MNRHLNENQNIDTTPSVPQEVDSIALFSRSTDDAMCVLRILGPANVLGLKVVRGVESGIVHFERVDECDLVVLQRDFSRDLDDYEHVVSRAHTAHKPVVMDLDDLLFELPNNHPDRHSYYYTDALLPMLQAVMEADLVTVATPALREYLQRFNENIKIFPNYLNDAWWRLNEPPKNEASDGSIIIGYMGGHTHKPDLEFILPALESIYKKYQPKVRFHFWGIDAPQELTAFSQVDWCPPKSYAYHDFASYFQTQTADIMIAPLVDSVFNRCKSCIKYLEYGSLGIPGIYSRVTPYASVIDDGVDGILATSLDEWERSLSMLIEDPSLRREIALNAQKKISKNWLLSRNAVRLSKIYKEVVRRHSSQPHEFPSYYLTLKSLTRQIYEGNPRIDQLKQQNQRLDDQINLLENQISQLNEQINLLTARIDHCEDEMVDYVLSTSWQVTRPLRIVTGKLKGTR